MAEARADRCETCRFWAEGDHVNGIGDCHRLPPAPNLAYLVVAAKGKPVPEDFAGDQLAVQGVWPSTCCDDWCGEWQGRGDTKLPPDPMALVQSLDVAAIAERRIELRRQFDALGILLRSANKRGERKA